jgi:hypothetical protein
MQKTQNRFGGEVNPLTFAPPYETGSDKEEKEKKRERKKSLTILLLERKKEREKVKKILQNERNSYLCNPNRKDGKRREKERIREEQNNDTD